MIDRTPQAQSHGLPSPTKTRFHILRSGLLNIYKYDYEEFRFEEGRLLLRGNNGTGKSRVLALQLPFLLDGEIVSHRVEPDCDPAKRMDWNLLMDKHADRLGYTWVEFGRQTDDGKEEFVTLGCGLRAVKGKGIHSRWFFVTPQRVGRDLFLQTEHGQPLSREKLELSVAGSGQVYRNTQDYRTAVDQALFQLGDRYHSLIDLLIQLRQPQLSRKLDEDRLSEALSEALPPLSSHLIDDVAESFRSLEADRHELDNYAAARGAVEAFLNEYSRYIQIAARRRAEQVRKTHSGYETTMRKLREAQREADEARADLEATSTLLDQLRVALSATRTEEQTLRDSPQMKDAQSLDEARIRAREKEIESTSKTAAHAHAVKSLDRAQQELQQQKAQSDQAGRNVEERNTRALETAMECGLEEIHRGTLASPTVFQQPDAREAAQRNLAFACDQRQKAISHLDQRNLELQAADKELARAEQRFQSAESQLGLLREAERDARETLTRETETLLELYTGWAGSVRVLQPMESDALAAAYEEWLDLRQGKNPLLVAVDEARRIADDLLSEERNQTRNALEEAQTRRKVLTEERDQLERGEHAAPPPPHTRDVQSRLNRPGAPLWKLCDFAPNLDPARRAGLEAALESSGLLDAWITPRGGLLTAGTYDHIVIPDFHPAHPPAASLADCLIPSIDATDPHASRIDAATLNRVFASIGVGTETGTHWVSFDGQWQLGPLRGAWSKPEPEHIGHTAREAMRQRRLRALAVQINEADMTLRALEARLAEIKARQEQAQQEHQNAPTDQRVLEASSQLSLISRQAANSQQQLEESEAALARSRSAHGDALRRRDSDAADLGIAAWKDRLRDLERRLGEYRTELAGLWPTIDYLLQARRHYTAASERVQQMEVAEAASAHALQEARQESESAKVRYRTLQATVGAGVEEVLSKLEETTRRIENLDAELNATTTRRETIAVREGVAKKEIETTTEALDHAATERSARIHDLHLFAEHRLLQEAAAELREIQPDEWSVSRAVEIARQVETLLKSIAADDEAWKRNQRDIHNHIATLQDALLHHGHQPQAIQIEEGIFVVTCDFQGKNRTMSELQHALGEELLHRQQMLDAREREVLENHLIGEVATELQQLIRRGEKLVQEMNDELQSRPMSTGMALRFAWQLDPGGPAGMEVARQHLMSTVGTWSPAEREALGGFLQERIKAVRAANDAGTWQEHLTEALDYRRWHRFYVERRQDDTWKRLTRRTYGTGSGGEKAIALTVPQFAAAAAHYRTAANHAPRLILLDEVFVGIDSDMRGKCMGLLEAFDLDFVMTSEREWGCYATVSGLAIYQLSGRPGIDAVGLTRWVWNGQTRTQDVRTTPSGRPAAGADKDTAPEGLLPTLDR